MKEVSSQLKIIDYFDLLPAPTVSKDVLRVQWEMLRQISAAMAIPMFLYHVTNEGGVPRRELIEV